MASLDHNLCSNTFAWLHNVVIKSEKDMVTLNWLSYSCKHNPDKLKQSLVSSLNPNYITSVLKSQSSRRGAAGVAVSPCRETQIFLSNFWQHWFIWGKVKKQTWHADLFCWNSPVHGGVFVVTQDLAETHAVQEELNCERLPQVGWQFLANTNKYILKVTHIQ